MIQFVISISQISYTFAFFNSWCN